jgi:hypothetical protein
VFAAKADTRRMGTSASRADCSALARLSQLDDFVTLHVTLHARLGFMASEECEICESREDHVDMDVSCGCFKLVGGVVLCLKRRFILLPQNWF